MRYAAILAYVAVGTALHVAFIGAEFDPLSFWTWAWLLAWPAMLFVIGVLLLFAAAIFAVVGTFAAVFAFISVTAMAATWSEA